MAASELSLELVYGFFKEKGGKVKNRDAVRHFKSYLTDPALKEENRIKFKTFVNTIANTRTEGDEKVLILKTKYLNTLYPPQSPSYPAPSPPSPYSPQADPRNSLGIPVSPPYSPMGMQSPPRQPPPYRPPPPPVYTSSSSLDTMSFGSMSSLNDQGAPQAPPRRRDSDRRRSTVDEVTPKKPQEAQAENSGEEKQGISVKERTQKFNRLASIEDELSPRQPKSVEKKMNNSRGAGGAGDDESDVGELPIESKKCNEWYVTASKGDCQELLRLANQEPRLVNKKDPFTTVLHWGAKYGNTEIIKIFAGRYHVDVNGKTNGGYTPLHISAQFGHKEVFKLLIEVYKADPNIRDYSGRRADYYLIAREQKGTSGHHVTLRKIKGRKKQSEKDLGFLRIGSLNVRVKKTTEAFSNFLGVGGGSTVNPSECNEKVLKGWGSADNVNKESMAAPKSGGPKKKSKSKYDSGRYSTPSTPRTPNKSFNSLMGNESDSDSAAGFDSHWKN